MSERLCVLCDEPIPDERNASAKYCSRQCAVYVAHKRQDERTFTRDAAGKVVTPRAAPTGYWLRIGPGHWKRITKWHACEVWMSPEGFDWTVRDPDEKALLASGIECRSTVAKHRAMAAARAA